MQTCGHVDIETCGRTRRGVENQRLTGVSPCKLVQRLRKTCTSPQTRAKTSADRRSRAKKTCQDVLLVRRAKRCNNMQRRVKMFEDGRIEKKRCEDVRKFAKTGCKDLRRRAKTFGDVVRRHEEACEDVPKDAKTRDDVVRRRAKTCYVHGRRRAKTCERVLRSARTREVDMQDVRRRAGFYIFLSRVWPWRAPIVS